MPGLVAARHPALARLQEAFARAAERFSAPPISVGLHARVRLTIEGESVDLVFVDERAHLEEISGTPDMSIGAAAEVWESILAPVPPPTFHSFTALQLKNPGVQVGGNPLRIAQSRQALERMFEALRPAAVDKTSQVERNLGIVVGRYATIDIDGMRTALFYEEAGRGLPVVFLHTAGADARQYQAFLVDVRLAERWNMFAFDMPAHGRSMPERPEQAGPYRLTQQRYASTVKAFLRDVVKRPAVLIGCSMGAAIALVVAAEAPDLLRAVIALEPPLKSAGRGNPYLAHPLVATGAHNAAYVAGLMSPTTPRTARRTAEWIYSQAAPSVYPGDLAFYSDEFDGTVVAPKIDTARVPIHLMTGEYDYSATPDDGARLSRLIAGSTFEKMAGLGHFPMVEDPDRVRSLLERAVERCLSQN
ncbi:alpha/beta fold hydrolase [Bradyrhizobium diazoefficiens]